MRDPVRHVLPAGRPRQGVALAVVTMISALAWAGMALTTTSWVAYGLALTDGAATIVLDVLVLTSLQRMLGNELLGRAFGAVDSLVIGSMLLGSLLAAPLSTSIGVSPSVLLAASFVFTVGVLVLARSRTIDRRAAERAGGLAPRVIASFKLNDNHRLYAQISKGFRLGGTNDQLNVPLCTAQDLINYGGHPGWEDETLWNYEVGSKNKFMGGRGSFNVAAYHAEIENLQAILTAGSCSSRIVLNVPKAQSTGGELELALAPNESFDFAISASLMDSTIESDVTVPGAGGAPVILAGIKSGNRLPTVPESQLAAAATYRWQFGGNVAGYATGVYQHVGSRFTQIGDQAAGFGTVRLGYTAMGGPFTQSTFNFDPELPAYDLVNLRVGVLRNQWDIAFFVNNITDERALLALDQERGSNARVGYLTNQPRTFGISTRVNF